MRFAWDNDKQADNLRKHGLDFADAATVFQHPQGYAGKTMAKIAGAALACSKVVWWSLSIRNVPQTSFV